MQVKEAYYNFININFGTKKYMQVKKILKLFFLNF